MPFTTQTGTTIGISAALPATFDAVGYGALTFVDVGEIINFGDLGKNFTQVNHQAVGRAYPEKQKGTYDISDVTLTVASRPTNAGQVLLKAAHNDPNASYSFQLALPSGVLASFTAKVIGMKISALSTNGVDSRSATLMIDPNSYFEA